MLLFQKIFQYEYISKTSALGGGEAAALLSQAHTFPTGKEMETHDEVMEVTLSSLTTGGKPMTQIHFPSRCEAFPTNQTSL